MAPVGSCILSLVAYAPAGGAICGSDRPNLQPQQTRQLSKEA